MRILFLVQKEQRIILDRLYEAVAANCRCDLRWLEKHEQADLRSYFARQVVVDQYDRIIFFLRFKQEIRQYGFIRSVPNLVILEHDAYQNFIPCKYTGKFSRHYRRLPGCRILTSGAAVTRKLSQEGFDAVFVPKGFDQTALRDMGVARDIELAFVGSLKSTAYSGRRALLEQLAREEPLIVTRTNSGDEYLDTLNRISFFVSADVGMGEYMIKNFEAMACGCVLLAYRQGDGEEEALGLADMENVVLYDSISELREKLALLRADRALTNRIASAGQRLATSRYSFALIGKKIVDEAAKPLAPRPPMTRLETLRSRCRWIP